MILALGYKLFQAWLQLGAEEQPEEEQQGQGARVQHRADRQGRVIEGQDLDAIVESDGPFSPAEAALVGQQLCSALAAVGSPK